MSPYAMALSPGFIRIVREATGMTQKEFADSIGVSASTIGSYETGDRKMSKGTWSKIKAVHREILDNLDVPDPLVTESELCIRPEHIRRIRIQTGMSQQEFADSIGVCKSVIGNVETGRCNVSDNLRMRVRERFPIQYRHVMFGGDSEDQAGRGDEEVALHDVAMAAKRDKADENSEVSVVIQSPAGAEITPEEIISRVGEADAIYIRVDHNAAYWVRGKETGKVALWG